MKDTLVVVTREGMGSADPALQQKLIGTYLKLLAGNGSLPGAIALYADGVKLACEGSAVVPQLAELESKGVHVILCRTCLEHFGLAEKVKVGVIGGMGDILAAQATAAKVVTL